MGAGSKGVAIEEREREIQEGRAMEAEVMAGVCAGPYYVLVSWHGPVLPLFVLV